VSFRVRISPEAERQVRELENWWAANRPAARTTFKEAFSALVGHISRMPGIGRPCDDIQLPGLRRLLMECTDHAGTGAQVERNTQFAVFRLAKHESRS